MILGSPQLRVGQFGLHPADFADDDVDQLVHGFVRTTGVNRHCAGVAVRGEAAGCV